MISHYQGLCHSIYKQMISLFYIWHFELILYSCRSWLFNFFACWCLVVWWTDLQVISVVFLVRFNLWIFLWCCFVLLYSNFVLMWMYSLLIKKTNDYILKVKIILIINQIETFLNQTSKLKFFLRSSNNRKSSFTITPNSKTFNQPNDKVNQTILS